jgi:hypothetical protein
MRKLLTVLGAGLLAGGITLAASSVNGRAAATTVKLEPASQNVSVSSSEFTVDVMVDQVDKLGAFEFQVDFDPDLVEFTDWEPGTFLDSAGGTPNCPSSVGPDKDRVLFGCGVQSTGGCATPGASGSGLLGTLHFKPKGKGTSTLVFSKGQMTIPQINFDACGGTNYDIFYTITDGAVTVYEGAAPTSVPATPVPNSARLTPTAVGAVSTGTPVGGAILGTTQTPASGVAGADGSSGSSSGSGSVAGAATARAGASGNFTGASGGPVAGHGPQDDHSNTGLVWGMALAAAGAAVLGGGVVARRARRSSYK